VSKPTIQWHLEVPIGISVQRNAGRGPDKVSVYGRKNGKPALIRTHTLWLATEDARKEFVDSTQLRPDDGASVPEQMEALLDLLDEAAQVVPLLPDQVPAAGPCEAELRADVVTLADIEVEPVRWLWPGRIPYGKLTVLEGDPGLGKSQLTLALAAAVTTGGTLPGDAVHDAGAGEPSAVLLLTGEDGLADTVKPRLQAAGGDPALVPVLRGVPDLDRPGEFRFPSLPGDVTYLLQEIRERRIRLVIVDTLTTYLGGEYNSFKDADVRRALAPLAHVAETTGCAIVLVRHLTKQSRGRAITAGGGSIGIVGGARSCLLLAEDPDSPELRVLAVVKANLAKKPDSLSLTIEEAPNGWPRVVWGGTSAHSADDLIAARGEEADHDKPAIQEARDKIRAWLADGLVPAEEVLRLAERAKIATRTLYRAKSKERVQSVKQGFGKQASWFWRLPEAPKVATEPITSTVGHLRDHGGRNSLASQGDTEDGHSAPEVAIFDGSDIPAAECARCGNPNAIRGRSGSVACPRCDVAEYASAFHSSQEKVA
jgi:AAA domain